MASTFSKTFQTLRQEGAGAAVGKVAHRTRFVLDLVAATRALRSQGRRMRDIAESLDFAYRYAAGEVTIAPAQVRTEIASLLELLEAAPPARVLEIGTARGGTLFLLARAAAADARIASIDLPGGAFGGGYDRMWIPLLKALVTEQQTLKLMRADSHDPKTFAGTAQWLAGDRLDFLLIDGDHRLEGVRRDFLTYGPLVRGGGLIAIHDIVPGSDDRVGGVPAFWTAVKGSYETRELVEDWNQGGYGLGVVQVPPGGISPGELLLEPSDSRHEGDSLGR